MSRTGFVRGLQFAALLAVGILGGSSRAAAVTITTNSLPRGGMGLPYQAQLTATGGAAPYSWSVTFGALPAGLTLNASSGVIGGTPSASGSFLPTFRVVDSSSPAQAAQFSLFLIVAPPVTITTTSLPDGVVGTQYRPSSGCGCPVQLLATGGNPPLTWSLAGGVLPAGLTLNSAGDLAGTPSSAGVFNFAVRVADTTSPAPLTATRSYSIAITYPVLMILTNTIPDGTVGVAYPSTRLYASGGASPYTWTIRAGALAAGLTLSSNGFINGTPTAAGAINLTVEVTDSAQPTPNTATQTYSATIRVPSITITTSTLRNGIAGDYYLAVTLQVTGGTAPYTWSIAAGSLPAGLTLNSATGSISGTPSTAGSFTFTVRASDSKGVTTTKQFTIVIGPASPLSVTPLSLNFGFQPGGRQPASRSITVSSTAQPLNFTVVPGTITGGSWLNVTPLSGTTPATVTVSVTVTNLSPGFYLGSVAIVSGQSGRGIIVNLRVGALPGLTATPASLTFRVQPEDTSPVPPQGLSLFASGGTVDFLATAGSTGGWLAVSPASGQTDRSLTVSIQGVANLRPGTYQGAIQITPFNAVPPSIPVPVNLIVEPPRPTQPQLNVSPPEISVTRVQGGTRAEAQLFVTNSAGGNLQFTAQPGASWLTIENPSGSVPPSGVTTVNLLIDPAGLAPGVHATDVTVKGQTSGQEQATRVILAISARRQSIQLSQTALEFSVQEGGKSPPAQTLALLNSGEGQMDWSAEAEPLGRGSRWLRVTPESGRLESGTAPTESLSISVDPDGLSPGEYYGSVRIAAGGAANSPQLITVRLNVVTPQQRLEVQASRAGVALVAPTGGSEPAGEEILVYNPSPRALIYSSTSFTEDGAGWFQVSPAGGVINAFSSAGISVIPSSLTKLPPGKRHGVARLRSDDGTVRTVDVVSVVTQTPTNPPASYQARFGIPNCKPSLLIPQWITLEQGFSVPSQEAVSLRIQVKDDCGNLVQGGAVNAFFSEDNGTLGLLHEGGGAWGGTWVPVAASASKRVVVRALTVQGGARLGGDSTILTGEVRAPRAAAAALAARVVNAATLRDPGQIALASWVSIFGDRLADEQAVAQGGSYPRRLLETEVLLGEQPLPLYFVSPSQVNALIPSGLEPNTQHQLLVRKRDTQSVGVAVTVAEIQPGIYSLNQQGTGQGAILIANTGLLAAGAGYMPGLASRPVHPGETLEIYATGLGLVTNAPADGTPAPFDPPAETLNRPTVTIGGISAPVLYSGLVPGLIGLYQVNAQVPNELLAGDAVPVVLTQGAIVSNRVTIMVE